MNFERTFFAAMTAVALVTGHGAFAAGGQTPQSAFGDIGSLRPWVQQVAAVVETDIDTLKRATDLLAADIATFGDMNLGTSAQKAKLAELGRVVSQLRQQVALLSPANPGQVQFLKDELASLQGQFASLTNAVSGKIVFVSATGSDNGDGSATQPLATLQKALETVKFRSKGKAGGWQVMVGGGTYYLPAPLKIDTALSGTPEAPFVIRAADGASPVISGAIKLDLQWTKAEGSNTWKAAYAGTPFDELFINGKRQIVARYPNSRYPESFPDINWGTLADINTRIARWSNPAGGFRHSLHSGHWGAYHQQILRKEGSNSVVYSATTGNNGEYGGGPSSSQTFVENIKEELDAPNEWFLDKAAGEVSVILDGATNPNTAKVEGAVLKGLVEIRGTQQAPVRDVTIRGFTFTQVGNTFMQTTETLLRSDWKIYRGGAIYVTGAENIKVGNNSIYEIGSNGVFVDGYARGIRVHDNEIHNTGASAIYFAGKEDAVRNPLRRYDAPTIPVSQIDPTPGPATQGPAAGEYPRESTADNNLIYHIGLKELQATGVGIDIAAKITVKHNSIYDVPRAGLNIGQGTWGGHVLEGNDVFNTVLMTGDHGSFNSWGRDRFWDTGFKNASYIQGKNYGELVKLDAIYQTIIRNNRFRCDKGWDVDLDDGSSNYLIENNVMIGEWGLKLREGYDRTVQNNIIIGGQGQIDPQIWPANSRDTIKYNILKAPHENVHIGTGARAVPSGSSDYNIFLSQQALQQQRNAQTKFPQTDLNSIVADPQFVDAENGDFTLKETSPALRLGFKNFPMVFGVQNEPLKSKAKKPGFELVDLDIDLELPPITFGEYEVLSIAANSAASSAYAIPNDLTGAGIIRAPAGGPLQAGDAVVFYDNNGTQAPIADAEHLKALLTSGRSVKLYVYRRQQLIELVMPAGPANLSLGATATATSSHPGYGPEKAIDGDGQSRWASAQLNVTLTQTFPAIVTIDRIQLSEQQNAASDGFSPIASFTIEADDGAGNWTEVHRGTTVRELTIPLSPAVSAKALRITMRGRQFNPSLYSFWAFKTN